jgi:hypothetical protein
VPLRKRWASSQENDQAFRPFNSSFLILTSLAQPSALHRVRRDDSPQSIHDPRHAVAFRRLPSASPLVPKACPPWWVALGNAPTLAVELRPPAERSLRHRSRASQTVTFPSATHHGGRACRTRSHPAPALANLDNSDSRFTADE